MATRRRRKAGRRSARARANPLNPVNPTRRRRSHRRRRSGVFARRRRNPVNPVRQRRRRFHGRRRHRRNPAGILGKAFTLAAGGALIGLVQPFVGRFVLPYIGASPLTNAGLAFGTGWLLSWIAGMTAFTRRWKDDILLAGGVVAAAQLISAYVVPQVRRLMPAGNNGMGRRGFNGIGMMTQIPPNAVFPPPPPQANGVNGMQGIGMRPGNYAQ